MKIVSALGCGRGFIGPGNGKAGMTGGGTINGGGGGLGAAIAVGFEDGSNFT